MTNPTETALCRVVDLLGEALTRTSRQLAEHERRLERLEAERAAAYNRKEKAA